MAALIVEQQRYLHEDLERLEVAVSERMNDEPQQIRDRLNRDHEVAQLLDEIQKESVELLNLYKDPQGLRSKEILQLGGGGDPFEEFSRQVANIKAFHDRHPNDQADNPEFRYRFRRNVGDEQMPSLVDGMFSGEEAFGRFFDLHATHEAYLNLPNVKRLSYLQWLEVFDNFEPGAGGVKRPDKMTDAYLRYLRQLMDYLDSFIRRTRPLEDLEKIFSQWDEEFVIAWENDEVEGWQLDKPASGKGATHTLTSADAVWCDACGKEFKNQNVYKGHLSGRKHTKAVQESEKRQQANGIGSAQRIKERIIAEREFRIKKLTAAMSVVKGDTKVNVERRLGMTERERQQELENFYNMTSMPQPRAAPVDDEDEDGEEKIYNPLKLPLAWDGKPIPFWLYRLHGLGVEFPCEICGGYTYRGRRAFDKHFNEAQHITNLRRLGITNTHLFRDIVSIEEAIRLHEKIQRDQKGNVDDGSVVQMEDAEGNVMPEKVYYDLQKQGLL